MCAMQLGRVPVVEIDNVDKGRTRTGKTYIFPRKVDMIYRAHIFLLGSTSNFFYFPNFSRILHKSGN